MYFLNNLCCLCLIHHKNLKRITTADNLGIVVEDKLKCCFPEIVEFITNVPKTICSACSEKLHTMYEFKQSVIKNNAFFQDYCNKLKLKEYSSYQQLLVVVRDLRTKLQTLNKPTDFTETEEGEHYFVINKYQNSAVKIINVFENNEVLSETNKVEATTDKDCKVEEMVKPENVGTISSAIKIEGNIELIEDSDPEEKNILSNLDMFIKEEPAPEENIFLNLEIDLTYDPDIADSLLTDNNHTNSQSFGELIQVKYKNTHKKKINKHQITFPKLHRCTICGKKFSSKKILIDHQSTHFPKYECNICGEKFRHCMTFLSHKRIHTGQLFKCCMCNKKFGRKFDMDRHQLTHSAIKPFKCHICVKSFIRKDKLRIHIESHYENSNK